MRTITARWYTQGRIEDIRVVVVHDMEAPESATTAENVARYFATTGTKASAHVCVDSDSRVRCVADAHTAWAAPGANADGLQLEIAGYARQTREQWLDRFSRAALEQAAIQTAEWCAKYGLPARRLTRAQLRAGHKGITSHADVSAVYRRSDHTDPGPNFPWAYFLERVQHHLGGAQANQEETVSTPMWPGRILRLTSPLMEGKDVRRWQRRMRARGWRIAVDGLYGRESAKVAQAFQAEKRLRVTGEVGRDDWIAAWEEPVT
ncbi:N-acetylmuramoyl-L-alanine amidase [Planobispora siamensis]|nr:N-acetylmuramoyl-L-alanine amidase [Planobispora siamensis]